MSITSMCVKRERWHITSTRLVSILSMVCQDQSSNSKGAFLLSINWITTIIFLIHRKLSMTLSIWMAARNSTQAFIFYKYLFANDTPVIVTEGKTDIRYIKAALKSLYNKYPRLIQKDAEGTFVYKFSFFKRTKRWKYFFGISLDGADAMRMLS